MADMNIFSMVLELPTADLGAKPGIVLWASVSVQREGELVSVDRGAHPSLTAYFNQSNEEEINYNQGEPATDWDNYLEPWSGVLAAIGQYSAEEAEEALRTVLPDVLRYDRGQPAAYPNGRTLVDDVTSARIAMVTNGKVPGDNIPPHTDLLDVFPYLGSPHLK